MGVFKFGVDEKVTCLEPVKLTSPQGELLCIGFKQHTTWFFAGISVADDGYVLRARNDGARFYELPDTAQLQALQAEGLLPNPLPPYSLSALDYVAGYSLWLSLALIVVQQVVRRWLTKRRQTRDALVPISSGPPSINTESDTFLRDALAQQLQPGEVVQHQAYALPDEGALTCLYVGLTNQRLILLPGDVGAFKPVHRHGEPRILSRDQLFDAEEHSHTITLELRGGGELTLFVPESRHFSNQVTFVRDVPRIFSQSNQGAAAVQVV